MVVSVESDNMAAEHFGKPVGELTASQREQGVSLLNQARTPNPHLVDRQNRIDAGQNPDIVDANAEERWVQGPLGRIDPVTGARQVVGMDDAEDLGLLQQTPTGGGGGGNIGAGGEWTGDPLGDPRSLYFNIFGAGASPTVSYDLGDRATGQD